MNRKNLIVLMIAAVAVGMFALPSTFSFEGSMHTFDQYNGEGDNAFCLKCHNDNINEQLNASDVGQGYYTAGTQTKIHSSVLCQGCHRITNATGGGYGQAAASVEHAARLPSCLDCHNGTLGELATTYGDAGAEMRAPTEAHKNFKFASDNDLECIACHTGVKRTGTVTYTYNSQNQSYANITIG